MSENEIARIVVNSALKVHRKLGPGLLESTYEKCLIHELNKFDLVVESQKKIPIVYDELFIDAAYKLDLLINSKVIIELKATEYFHNVHFAQLLTYLKLTDCKLGLLINFNVTLIREGIKRVANGKIE
ncbi:MAG: GxxExxY protein [Flavobacteriia bacterium]|nr:GxxExxY protein [Flavobacteriia bacterium]